MVDMDFIRDNAAKIMAASDVSYLKSADMPRMQQRSMEPEI